MSKNDLIKEMISLKNSLDEKIKELSQLTDFEYDEIEIKEFQDIKKDEFLQNNLAYKIEVSKEKMLQQEYMKDKSDYMPSLALQGDIGYSSTDYDGQTSSQSGDSYSVGLNLSIPLDFYQGSKIDVSKTEYLMQKQQVQITLKETLSQYDRAISQIDTYKAHNKLLKENIDLYNDLIEITTAKVNNGYESQYELDILKNTKYSDMLELQINRMNIKQQLVQLYVKMMGK